MRHLKHHRITIKRHSIQLLIFSVNILVLLLISYVSLDRNNGQAATSLPNTPVPINPSRTPVNLRPEPSWDDVLKKPIDILHWDTVEEAVSYNIYDNENYRVLAKGVKETSYRVPANKVNALWTLYTVTAVDSSGQESIPSNPASAVGGLDPTKKIAVSVPPAPVKVKTESYWSIDQPRIEISWQHDKPWPMFNIYRDGVKISENLWGLTYIDTDVEPGRSYSYTVKAVKNRFAPKIVESEPSKTVTRKAVSGPPGFSDRRIKITKIEPNHNSAKIYFEPVAGAVDYRAYNVLRPWSVKYSAGGTQIEMNGITPGVGGNFVVEAVDQLGPYHTMDGAHSPGTLQKDGSYIIQTNGIDDPSHVPNVIAKSDPFAVTTKTFSLTGAQAFLDTFDEDDPMKLVPKAEMDPNLDGRSGAAVAQFENKKWQMTAFGTETSKIRSFIMNRHAMDTLYDKGRTIRGWNYWQPKASANPSTDGGIYHATFEVDAYFHHSWMDIVILPADDLIVDPNDFSGKGETLKGGWLRWVVDRDDHELEVSVRDNNQKDTNRSVGFASLKPSQRKNGDPTGFNGPITGNIDFRHKFDIYLSKTRVILMEEGKIVKNIDLTKVCSESKPCSEGTVDRTLPWVDRPLTFAVSGVLYHSDSARFNAHASYNAHNDNDYYVNYTPFRDERHWNNMGMEVVDKFPDGKVADPDPGDEPEEFSDACIKISLSNRPTDDNSHSRVAIQFRDKATGNTLVTLRNQVSDAAGVITIRKEDLAILDNTKEYTVWVKPSGYLARRHTFAKVRSDCAVFPADKAIHPADFDGDNRINVGDLLALVKAKKGEVSDSVKEVYKDQGISLADIMDVIRRKNALPDGMGDK